MQPEPDPDTKPRSLLAKIFVSPDERRPRAGWRLLGQLIVLSVLSTIFLIILGFLVVYAGGGINNQSQLLVAELAVGLAITLSVFIARVFLDNRSITSLGLQVDRQMWIDFGRGIGIAFVMFLIIFLVLYLAGGIMIEGWAWQSQSLSALLTSLFGYFFLYIVVGWQEELLFRGYWLQNLADGMDLKWGVISSSVVFSLLHLGNPGYSWASTIGLFFAGLFLAYGYVATRSLWLPIGLHIGWNFFEGPIFGFNVSGLSSPSLIEHTSNASGLVSGGAFGPEAGLVLIPALLVGSLLIYLLYQRKSPVENAAQEPQA